MTYDAIVTCPAHMKEQTHPKKRIIVLNRKVIKAGEEIN
jgi:hypothetical protein